MQHLQTSLVKKLSVLLMTVALISTGCKKDKDPVYGPPSISINGDATAELKPGAAIIVQLTINGDGGARSVVVKKGGGLLEEVPVDASATSFTYNTQTVPSDLTEGEEVQYSFALVNRNEVTSSEVTYTVKAAVYDKIKVGAVELYDIDIPADGIVSSGSAVTLVTGRNYHLSKSLVFETGSTFRIAEGVSVYVKVNADDPVEIDIQGEADIEGTAAAPVVFTSAATLDGTPAPGDWTWLRLTGSGNASSNGKIKYARIEYAGDRAFRLTDVGEATAIDYVQVYRSSGEGVMVTDGNARLKHIIATDCEGGSYRLGDAYTGYMQFLISVNSGYFNENDDFAIREDAAPTIANVTLLGGGEDLSDNTHGMRMRANAKPRVYNTVIAEFPRRGLRGNDNLTVTDPDGDAVFAYSYIFKVPKDPYRDLAVPFAGTFDPATGERLTNPFHNNVTKLLEGDFEVEEIAGIGKEDFVPDAEQASDFNPSAIHSFFSTAAWVGAVNNAAGDWTKGWAKNPDGSIR